jgi:hypothetical protein
MSITLTTPKKVALNDVVIENNTQGACMGYSIDFFSNTFVATLRTGVVQGGNLNAGVYGDLVTLTVNLTTGAWTSSNGLTGTVPGGALANFVNQFKTDRNATESYAAGSSGIMPGVQVPW